MRILMSYIIAFALLVLHICYFVFFFLKERERERDEGPIYRARE
jgi:hypothetical protein